MDKNSYKRCRSPTPHHHNEPTLILSTRLTAALQFLFFSLLSFYFLPRFSNCFIWLCAHGIATSTLTLVQLCSSPTQTVVCYPLTPPRLSLTIAYRHATKASSLRPNQFQFALLHPLLLVLLFSWVYNTKLFTPWPSLSVVTNAPLSSTRTRLESLSFPGCCRRRPV